MSTLDSKPQTGCRECGGITWHKGDCSLNIEKIRQANIFSGVFCVLDSERATEDSIARARAPEYERVFLRSRNAPFKLTDPPFSTVRVYDTDIEYVRVQSQPPQIEAIRTALAECELVAVNARSGNYRRVEIEKLKWEALVDAIK